MTNYIEDGVYCTQKHIALTTASLRVGEHNQDDTKTRLHTNKQGGHKKKKKKKLRCNTHIFVFSEAVKEQVNSPPESSFSPITGNLL